MTDHPENLGTQPARKLQTIPVALIDVSDRLREIDADYVTMLAESIRQIGLSSPIEVRDSGTGRYRLVAGGHRFAAVVALGLTEIEAFVVQLNDLSAKLREIHENLYRHELSPFDRAVFLAEAKSIWLEMYPDTARGVAGGKAIGKSTSDIVSFVKNTALSSGYSSRTIERAIRLFDDLAPAVRAALRGSPIARDQAELVRLSKLPPAEQVRVVELLKTPDGPRRVTQAHAQVTGQRAMPPTATDKDFGQLVDRYSRAGMRGRRAFIRWLLEAGDLDDIAPELLARRAAEHGADA